MKAVDQLAEIEATTMTAMRKLADLGARFEHTPAEGDAFELLRLKACVLRLIQAQRHLLVAHRLAQQEPSWISHRRDSKLN